MPELISQAADNPEFARVVESAQLRDLREFAFDIASDAEEAAALARLIDARAVRRLRFQGRLLPLPPGGGWQLEGKLGATVVQTCVVTLDPVTTRVDQAVVRRFVPGRGPQTRELVLDPEADDEVELLSERIDLGLIAVESLALALPAYPRRPGAALPAPGESSLGTVKDSIVKPFGVLAALRDKMRDPS